MAFGRFAARFIVILAFSATASCREVSNVRRFSVPLNQGQTYRLALDNGDEDSAQISTQALHFATSEIRRDVTTSFVSTYVYQAQPGYIGPDDVAIELLGSNGSTGPLKSNVLVIHFEISCQRCPP